MQQIDILQTTGAAGHIGPIAGANLKSPAVDPFEAFVAPGDVFRHPDAVLAHPGLSRAEKRTILASWASDARAVDSCPTLRCLPGCRAEPVPIDDILAALQALDDGSPAGGGATATARGPHGPAPFARRRQRAPDPRRPVLN